MEPKSRLAYVLLAAFLGAFGIHNFYANRILQGVTQLVLTFTWVSVIVPFWIFYDIFFVTTDGDGRKMTDESPFLRQLISVIIYFPVFIGFFVLLFFIFSAIIAAVGAPR